MASLRLLLVVFGCLGLARNSVATENNEQCRTYAGGHVYPNTEGRASGHTLQWTKAMSMLIYCTPSCLVANKL